MAECLLTAKQVSMLYETGEAKLDVRGHSIFIMENLKFHRRMDARCVLIASNCFANMVCCFTEAKKSRNMSITIQSDVL